MTKQELRQEIRRRKAACSIEERAVLSRGVIAKLTKNPLWQQAQVILLYHSLPDEVDTRNLICQAGTEGKRVLLPVVVGDDLELRMYQGTSQLRAGSFHILEPVGEPFVDYQQIDLAVIPGVAFTPDGVRLGRGRGYYDRLLPRLTTTYKMGICWPFQLVDAIPTEPHDIRMDSVIC
jgi:5-formyltetrahydrofolate cyclo-ligase